ncbi:MAG: glutamine-hydrolyzing GMP synthase [Alphaproteobacteria bacterium]|nr:glutamine-hydrolyzing GMP synthase [Alphaproteobacteria bacterium]
MDRILIIDFGSQFTQLIARRIRELGVYCEVLPFNKMEEHELVPEVRGIILSGGPASAHEGTAPSVPEIVFSCTLPVLGICYGAQAICVRLGGVVESHQEREFGRASVRVVDDCLLFDGLWFCGESHDVWMSHGDKITALPEGFRSVATSQSSPFAVICDEKKRIYGIQFHPEVIHTPDGNALLSNFVCKVANCSQSWTMSSFRERSIASLRAVIGTEKVICALSGGVDSTVAAVLLYEAIGEQLTCIFVDHGFMRKGEADEVISLFCSHYAIPFVHVNAAKTFMEALKGERKPEQKRKIIGQLFIDVFEKEAKALGNVKFLAQGTLYSDIIESVSHSSGAVITIKSHHNVGGLPEEMNLKLVEPLKDLFKDEVRLLGRELGLPEAFVGRHPFPGPGLAIRCPGPVTQEKIEMLRKADSIYLEEIRNAGLYDLIWQAFAVLLPVRTVGVMGDLRTYECVCALRAVISADGMTADFYRYDMDFLSLTATRIINEVEGINRVVYDVTSKPPGTIEWE